MNLRVLHPVILISEESLPREPRVDLAGLHAQRVLPPHRAARRTHDCPGQQSAVPTIGAGAMRMHAALRARVKGLHPSTHGPHRS